MTTHAGQIKMTEAVQAISNADTLEGRYDRWIEEPEGTLPEVSNCWRYHSATWVMLLVLQMVSHFGGNRTFMMIALQNVLQNMCGYQYTRGGALAIVAILQ